MATFSFFTTTGFAYNDFTLEFIKHEARKRVPVAKGKFATWSVVADKSSFSILEANCNNVGDEAPKTVAGIMENTSDNGFYIAVVDGTPDNQEGLFRVVELLPKKDSLIFYIHDKKETLYYESMVTERFPEARIVTQINEIILEALCQKFGISDYLSACLYHRHTRTFDTTALIDAENYKIQERASFFSKERMRVARQLSNSFQLDGRLCLAGMLATSVLSWFVGPKSGLIGASFCLAMVLTKRSLEGIAPADDVHSELLPSQQALDKIGKSLSLLKGPLSRRRAIDCLTESSDLPFVWLHTKKEAFNLSTTLPEQNSDEWLEMILTLAKI
jgi:hypothetical protein